MKFDNYMDPRKTLGKAVTQEAEKNEDIVVLSADSGKSSGFGEFIEKYPDRYFECGIMEQGVIGISSSNRSTASIAAYASVKWLPSLNKSISEILLYFFFSNSNVEPKTSPQIAPNILLLVLQA